MKQTISQFIWNLLVNVIAKSILIHSSIRYIIYRIAGMRTQSNNIRSGCTFRGKSIFIEEGVFLNHNVFIDAWERVSIGRNVSIAFNVSLITSSHEIGGENNRAGKSLRKPITIDEGCWIGANSTILGGVTIGKGCVIAAGSVVNKNCKPNTLYGGVPATEIRKLNTEYEKVKVVI